jgi:hypothetical protein
MGFFDSIRDAVESAFERFFGGSDSAPDPLGEVIDNALDIDEPVDTSWIDDARPYPEGFADYVETSEIHNPSEWESATAVLEVGGGHIEYTVDGERFSTEFASRDELWDYLDYLAEEYDIQYDIERDS